VVRTAVSLLIGGAIVFSAAGSALAQYPPSPAPLPSVTPSPTRPRCTFAEREAFTQKQQAKQDLFRTQQRQNREAFRATGPHSPQERRIFNRLQRQARAAFQAEQRAERDQFLASCSENFRASASRRPMTVTVGHLTLAALGGLGVLLLARRRWVFRRARR